MTDRVKALTVHLDDDYHIEDAGEIAAAIQLLRGVATVEPWIVTSDDLLARERVRRELITKVLEVLS